MKDSKGRLITDTMYCALCPKSFKYNQSPSPLTDHLKYHHSDKMLELENSQKQSQSKLTDFRFMKTDVQENYKASHPKQKKFRDDLGEWIIRNIVKNLDPRIKVPVTQLLPRISQPSIQRERRLRLRNLRRLNTSQAQMMVEHLSQILASLL